MLKITKTGSFLRMLEEVILNDEVLEGLIREKIKLFIKNPNDTRLRNHKLTRRMKGKWAFSITGDIRIVYEWTSKNSARFLAIGTHQQVY